MPGEERALGLALPHRPLDAEPGRRSSASCRSCASTTAASSTCQQYVPAGLDGATGGVHICPPAIDPLSPKNMALSPEDAAFVCDQFGIDVDRPLICQVSRFDPWKDPIGRDRRLPRWCSEEMPEVQLALVGSMATDDPEGWEFFNSTLAYADGDPDIHILNNLNNVGAIEVNAFQSQADVVIQKSTREGFGLTVSEALWKARPFIGGDVGGIPLQVKDGETGYLVSSPEECADALAAHPARARPRQAARPRAARSTCASTSSRPACCATGCGSSRTRDDADDAQLVLVSNRGPATFERDEDGELDGTPRRRRPGHGADRPRPPPRRALGRVGDDRRGRRGEPRSTAAAVVRAATLDDASYRMRLVESRPGRLRRASTTWWRTRCCGSSSTTSGTSRTRRTSAATRSTPTSRATAVVNEDLARRGARGGRRRRRARS